eukprot:5006430-Prymnesium_polylepis.1
MPADSAPPPGYLGAWHTHNTRSMRDTPHLRGNTWLRLYDVRPSCAACALVRCVCLWSWTVACSPFPLLMPLCRVPYAGEPCFALFASRNH